MRQAPTSFCPITTRHTPSIKNPTEKLIAATVKQNRDISYGHAGHVYAAAICTTNATNIARAKKRKATDNSV
jgi:hypothetical protein